jgi:hypothetical protein
MSNESNDVEQAIAESLRFCLHERDQIRWCVPLTMVLELKRQGLAMKWLISATRTLLESNPSPHRHRLLEDIAFLESGACSEMTHEELAELCREIWDRKPCRDDAQTAISKLFDSYATFRFAPHRVLFPIFQTPVDVLIFRFGPHEWNEETASRRQGVYHCFRQMMLDA